MDGSGEGVVQRDIVFGEQGAAGGGGTECAEAHSLRGGVGDQRTGAAEELEAGKLAELVVECGRGGGAEGLLSEEARGDGAFERAERGAVGGDRYLLGVGGGLEAEDGAVGDLHGLVRETRSGDADAAGNGAGDGQAAGRIGAAEELSGGVSDGGAGQRRAAAVFNGCRQVVAGGVTGFVRGGSPRPTTPRSAPARQTSLST